MVTRQDRTIRDMEGVSHTVEVTASSLFEAVAQGFAAMRGKEWVDGFPQGTGVVKVSVADVRVEHEVRMADFERWLERPKPIAEGNCRPSENSRHSRHGRVT